ncbi:Response regulator receiver protein (fragment) [Candidatus Sulfotelmatomonas gaucii]|uniref:Response regulator receiver protein n=1 Tax=Candidatus Sulfuritelmatomonas gaucii TaxID=2043161 RepID=A0A2N9L3V9_9BACT
MASASVFLIGENASNIKLPHSEASDAIETQRDRPIVLLVDDEQLIVDTLAEILEGAGFFVLAAYDGWTALEKVARCRPEYLLSDVLMPKMNGVELAIAIRKMYPSTRITLFSGQAGISDILLDGKRQGFEFELIAKPIHPLKLVEHLKGKRTDLS